MAEIRIPTDSYSRQRDSDATPCDTNAALPATATQKPTGHGVSLGWPASARSGSETVSFISSSQADCACALVPCRRTPASLFCRACGACRAGVDAAVHGPGPGRVGRIRSSSLRRKSTRCGRGQRRRKRLLRPPRLPDRVGESWPTHATALVAARCNRGCASFAAAQ